MDTMIDGDFNGPGAPIADNSFVVARRCRDVIYDEADEGAGSRRPTVLVLIREIFDLSLP